jgi:hypothetical protein
VPQLGPKGLIERYYQVPKSLDGGVMTKSTILGCAAGAALIGAMAFTPMASAASIPSSPAERAATAQLNRNISSANEAEEARARAQELQYQEQLRQQARQYEEQRRLWEQQQQQYLALLNRTR